jgi:hypothetical protein
MATLFIVEGEVPGKSQDELRDGLVALQIDVLILYASQSRSMNTLSSARPRPSLLMAMSWLFSTPVNASLVN